jgi:streptogramin lyase
MRRSGRLTPALLVVALAGAGAMTVGSGEAGARAGHALHAGLATDSCTAEATASRCAEEVHRQDGEGAPRLLPPVPNDGGVGVGAGSVWAIDREGGGLFRIDPATNTVVSQVAGVIDAAPVVGGGAVWVPSLFLNTLFRVDLATLAATRIPTGPSDDEAPITAVVAAGAVWVGNHHGGTVARVDPNTDRLVATIPWGPPGGGGIYHMATDGSSIWVTGSRTDDVTEIDTATNAIVKRTQVPPVLAAASQSMRRQSGSRVASTSRTLVGFRRSGG